ncbi:MAG: hypothetical protein ABI165_11520, partial [Bryobacteraceae bacterium]
DHAGPPVYLTRRLKPAQRAAYAGELAEIAEGFRKLSSDVPEKKRIAKILQCIANVRADLRSMPA